MKYGYNEVNDKKWHEIHENNNLEYVPPLTVHMPIQPMHSPDIIHVDGALNACRRRIIPGLSNRDVLALGVIDHAADDTMIVQFAFGDPPFVPDFHLSKMGLADSGLPVVWAEYFAHDIRYTLEYSCCEIAPGVQSLLCISLTAINEGIDSQRVHIRSKVNFQPEEDIFDYHYVPFWWDASKWLSCEGVSLEDTAILRDGQRIGRIISGDFTCEWEKSGCSVDSDYNKRFSCD